MKYISNLSNKVKFLILIIYIAIAILITALLVSSGLNGGELKGYNDLPEDENITLNIKLMEDRESHFETNSKYEESSTNLYFFVSKKTKDAVISSITMYVTFKTNDGARRYAELVTTSNNITSSNSTYYYSGNKINTTGLLSKKINVSNDVVTITNNEPTEIYVRFIYTISTNTGTKRNTILYKNSVDAIKDKQYASCEERKIDGNGFVENRGEPIDFLFQKTFTSASTTSGGVEKDLLYSSIYLNNSITNNETVVDMSLRIMGLAENDSKDEKEYFSNYINLFSYYGVVNGKSINSMKNSYDEKYDIKLIYVFGKMKLTNGKNYSFSFYINTADIQDK